MKISKLFIVAMGLFAVSCSSRELVEADYAVVPLPESITIGSQSKAFKLGPDTRIVASDSAQVVNARLFAGYVKTLTGFEPAVVTNAPAKNFIRLCADLDHANTDAYVISVNVDSIVVDGASPAATFYGLQTLRKSIPGAGNYEVLFPAGTIADAPRFAYRGAHFDTARHFFAPDSVKMFIDMIALHNINRMHWHITDDQGWRLEIDGLPELTEVGSKRAGTAIGHTLECDSIPYGGYYTADEVRDIVKYAADRHITIIPEIDLPGHMQAALASYPELGCSGGPYEVWCRWGVSEDVLCAGNDSVYAFLDDVMDQVVELFPSEYIHIGGDECPKVRWHDCPKCQAKIKALGLKNDNESTAEQKLQSYVMNYVANHLASKGRKVIGWDEILEGGVDTSTVIMSWRGTEGGITAAKAGHDAIMTPNQFMYFDFRQSDDPDEPRAATWGDPLTVEKVYSYEPIPDGLTSEEAGHIIGVQANLWCEHIPNYRQAEYMEMPRIGALAEVQWSKAPKDYDAFFKRLERLTKIYDAEDYNYRKAYFVQPDSVVANTDEAVATEDAEPIAELLRLNCSYIVDPDKAPEAIELARRLIAASQADGGVIDYDMYQSETRPGHFVIFETWKDQPSLDAHSASSHFTTLVPKMQEFSPLGVDRFEKIAAQDKNGKKVRINSMMTAGDNDAREQMLAVAKELVAASQQEEGVIDYDIYSSVTNPFKLMIFETWESQPALDAHGATEHFKTFVPQLTELSASKNVDIFYF